MGVVPVTIIGKIQFFEEHLPVWSVAGAAIGLTAPQIADLAARTAAARASYDAAGAARGVARAATLTQNADVGSMSELGADLIKVIRAFAEAGDDPSVYAAAQIPPPAPPAPLGPPQTPTDLSCVLTTSGHMDLAWGGSRHGGTSFLIERCVNGVNGPWTLIGTSEERVYTDQSVPSAVSTVSYRVTAVRSGGQSEPTSPFTVFFGTAGAGSETALGLAA